jgi:hypothetical protein
MESEHPRSYVGRAQDLAKQKGWIFGSFMDEPELKSDLVEVAWQQIPNLKPSPDQEHYHRETIEINLLIKGQMTLKIDGRRYDIGVGDFYVIWPESVVSDLETDADTEVIVVRAPSKNDKVLVNEPES